MPREQHANGAIYQAGYDVALFENAVAHRVGDTLTINLMESTAAQKSSSTSTSKSTHGRHAGRRSLGGTPLTIGGKEILGRHRTTAASSTATATAARATSCRATSR